MLLDYIRIALGSLRKRILRTSLTMLGIFIGIAAVVALISLGQGMQDAINGQFASIGADKIIIHGTSAAFGPPGQFAAGVIDEDDLKLISQIPGVDRAAGRLLRGVTIEFQDETQVFMLASLPAKPNSRDLVIDANNLKVKQGRLLKASDSAKVMIGYDLWNKELFDKKIKLGNKLIINGKKFQVVGLMDKIGAGRDDSIIANEQDARDLLDVKKEYSGIFAQVNAGADPAKVADRVLRAIRRDRGQKEGFEDVTVETSQELIGTINTILTVVQMVFIGIAGISLLVGGIGIMNTMYTSVLERQREIGIMKAIGARNEDILKLFMIESGVLGLLGGIIGVLLGVGLSKLVEFAAKGVVGDVLQATFSPWLIIGALTFAFGIGMISGVLPAIQASKLQPVEALRK